MNWQDFNEAMDRRAANQYVSRAAPFGLPGAQTPVLRDALQSVRRRAIAKKRSLALSSRAAFLNMIRLGDAERRARQLASDRQTLNEYRTTAARSPKPVSATMRRLVQAIRIRNTLRAAKVLRNTPKKRRTVRNSVRRKLNYDDDNCTYRLNPRSQWS